MEDSVFVPAGRSQNGFWEVFKPILIGLGIGGMAVLAALVWGGFSPSSSTQNITRIAQTESGHPRLAKRKAADAAHIQEPAPKHPDPDAAGAVALALRPPNAARAEALILNPIKPAALKFPRLDRRNRYTPIEHTYDKFDDRSTFETNLGEVFDGGREYEAIRTGNPTKDLFNSMNASYYHWIECHAVYWHDGPHRPVPTDKEEASLAFVSRAFILRRFSENDRLTILYDENKRLRVDGSQLGYRLIQPERDVFMEYFRVSLPMTTFLEIVNSPAIEVKIGTVAFALNENQRAGLLNYAAHLGATEEACAEFDRQ